MSGQDALAQGTQSSVIFQNDEQSIIVVDIPRSLEEAQVPRGHKSERHILSTEPITAPFATPEPKDALIGVSSSAAAQVAELMTTATVESALDELAEHFSGQFCLPRMTSPEDLAKTNAEHHIPNGAQYIQGNIEDTRNQFLQTAPDFDLIVLDPPWPNRSVRRKTDSYDTASTMFELRELLAAIPVSLHLKKSGLLAVWITNKPSIYELLTSNTGVLALWGVELVAEWTWVKVTTDGRPIYGVNSRWRKPWEKLLIARRIGDRNAPTVRPKVVFAVPDVHSRKPSLRGLFENVFENGDYACLEVFARNLTAGWWSWGNEVLRFQETQHWAPKDGN